MSVSGSEVVADDFQVSDPAGEAARLSPLLGVPAAQLQTELSERSGFVVLASFVDQGTASRIAGSDASGITLLPASRRFYPDGALASELVGQVHADGSGASGLEYLYDSQLAGVSGKEVLVVGPGGNEVPDGVLKATPSRPGATLLLTLSRSLEYLTKRALASEMLAAHARWGSVVVLDSHTGGILAMVNLQAGQPSQPAPVEASSNLAVTRVFEPGSVMKLATFSAALTRGLLTPDTAFQVPDHLIIDGSLFHDAEVHPTERLTATQILAQSSNVGTIKIAQALGKQELYHYLTAFGFGEPTGLDFPGGSPGILNPPSAWSGTALASTAIGQDEAVTLLQLADAYNAIANGGMFVPPRLVRAVVGPNGQVRPVPAKPSRRVVSATVASELVSMLEHVVSTQGTAPGAALPYYPVAGKTGTAQIPWRNHAGYQPGAFMATFVGFAPATHPAVTVAVVLDRPTPIYGGSVAAPVFAQVATDALMLMHVPPPSGAAAPVVFQTGPRLPAGLPTSKG